MNARSREGGRGMEPAEMSVAGTGTVEEIYIAPKGSAPMIKAGEVEAIASAGLAGDRYLTRTGYWTGIDECQVTLIEGEALDHVRATSKVDVDNGRHRRNIVTRGIDLSRLTGRRFRIGSAVLEYDRPRPPCRYIQSVSEHGMTRALGGGRGGICARVIASGTIKVGDSIDSEVAGTPPTHVQR